MLLARQYIHVWSFTSVYVQHRANWSIFLYNYKFNKKNILSDRFSWSQFNWQTAASYDLLVANNMPDAAAGGDNGLAIDDCHLKRCYSLTLMRSSIEYFLFISRHYCTPACADFFFSSPTFALLFAISGRPFFSRALFRLRICRRLLHRLPLHFYQ